MSDNGALVLWFDDVGREHVELVGGKNASLGEMIRELGEAGIRVPRGFATTAHAYREYLAANELEDPLRSRLEQLTDATSEQDRREIGQSIRTAIREGSFPDEVASAIRAAYKNLAETQGTDSHGGSGTEAGSDEPSVAVRSSATAEDLPDASFAGQQETFLNVRGEEDLLEACRKCYASLFTDRAISYREEHGFDHLDVALSVGVQEMVRSDLAGAGVMFTVDTETGFPNVVLINAAWGLGESVVGGTVNPDEYRVFKPSLADEKARPVIDLTLGDKRSKVVLAESASGSEGGETTVTEVEPKDRRRAVLDEEEILTLARWACVIEEHYGQPMDIEWAKDGASGEIFVVQARPETVQSGKTAATLRHYSLEEQGELLLEGLAIGTAIAAGRAFVLEDLDHADRFERDGVLVTGMTDPDWVPLMRRAAAIVTDQGGRTSHAAIVSRELGVPAVIGTGIATDELDDGTAVTVSCAEGETGRVYDGELEFETTELDPSEVPETETRVTMNLASPDAALRWWNLPVDGIGLARMEFIINNAIKIHPLALARFDEIENEDTRERILELTAGYDDKAEYFVEHLARGIARIAASRFPDQVLVRLSDFKTNEYARLIGGPQFEPDEENPMLGFRGAGRYYSDHYRDGFALECRAIRRAREVIGLDNIAVMVPFCRTPEEADKVFEEMAKHGLKRGENGLTVYVMAEIPSNIIRAEEFAERFDGFSIGSNDLTQLVLGVGRDSEALAPLFDERDPAVQHLIADLIERAHAADKPVSICGQAPSDHPEFAAFLVDAGIDAISVNPDSVIEVRRRIAEAERAR